MCTGLRNLFIVYILLLFFSFEHLICIFILCFLFDRLFIDFHHIFYIVFPDSSPGFGLVLFAALPSSDTPPSGQCSPSSSPPPSPPL